MFYKYFIDTLVYNIILEFLYFDIFVDDISIDEGKILRLTTITVGGTIQF